MNAAPPALPLPPGSATDTLPGAVTSVTIRGRGRQGAMSGCLNQTPDPDLPQGVGASVSNQHHNNDQHTNTVHQGNNQGNVEKGEGRPEVEEVGGGRRRRSAAEVEPRARLRHAFALVWCWSGSGIRSAQRGAQLIAKSLIDQHLHSACLAECRLNRHAAGGTGGIRGCDLFIEDPRESPPYFLSRCCTRTPTIFRRIFHRDPRALRTDFRRGGVCGRVTFGGVTPAAPRVFWAG